MRTAVVKCVLMETTLIEIIELMLQQEKLIALQRKQIDKLKFEMQDVKRRLLEIESSEQKHKNKLK